MADRQAIIGQHFSQQFSSVFKSAAHDWISFPSKFASDITTWTRALIWMILQVLYEFIYLFVENKQRSVQFVCSSPSLPTTACCQSTEARWQLIAGREPARNKKTLRLKCMYSTVSTRSCTLWRPAIVWDSHYLLWFPSANSGFNCCILCGRHSAMMKKANKLSTIMLLSIWALVPLVRAKDDSRQDVDCVPCDMLFTKLHESPTSASKRVQHVQMQLRGEPSFFPPEVDNTSL